ncbi:MAG: DUF1820 family protein [Deltaproteobacteria bacterium]|nr:DUF1820 family protein [Deltaproteobacteria bacterium]
MPAKTKDKTHYVITYRDPKDTKIVSLKAGRVTDSSLGLSFIAISDFVFSSSMLVVNPEEEDLKRRLIDVKTLHISIYTIISIEEVGPAHKGLHFKKDKSNLLVLPGTVQPPKGN